jgi:hypothetical protein
MHHAPFTLGGLGPAAAGAPGRRVQHNRARPVCRRPLDRRHRRPRPVSGSPGQHLLRPPGRGRHRIRPRLT